MAPSPPPAVSGRGGWHRLLGWHIGTEPAAGSGVPRGWGEPLREQGFCNLLQALFKLGKKVK